MAQAVRDAGADNLIRPGVGQQRLKCGLEASFIRAAVIPFSGGADIQVLAPQLVYQLASARPVIEAVVDRRAGTIHRRAVPPPAAALDNMQNATDQAPIIDTNLLAGLQVNFLMR